MSKAITMLSALQHGDSFYPSGSSSFSWGLETLVSEGAILDGAGVEMFIRVQLEDRWASFDRAVVSTAYEQSDNLEEICRIDSLVEAQTLTAEMRDGSHRSGHALLQVHEKLNNPRAADYRALIRSSVAYGNLNVMQGFLWAGSGMSVDDTGVVSAHTLCTGLLGAAIRLGVIGHIDAQRILSAMHLTINEVVDSPPPRIDNLQAFTPVSEIAMMRHETIESRLFAN